LSYGDGAAVDNEKLAASHVVARLTTEPTEAQARGELIMIIIALEMLQLMRY
jgi:hypothetical protein